MKQFLLKFSFWVFLSISISFSLSYYLDIHNIFSENFNVCIVEPNQRYIKTKHLLKKKLPISLVVGSSRVGRIKVPDNGKWYNFTSSESLVSESLEDLKILYNNSIKIDTILLGIDNISLYVDNHEGDYMRMGFNEFNKFEYLKETLSIKSLIKKILTQSKIYNFESTLFDLETGNVQIPKHVDEFIKNNPKEHEKRLILSGPSWNEKIYNYRIENFKQELLELNSLTKENQTELIIFINPLWIKTFERIPKKDWLEFKKFLNYNFKYTDFNNTDIGSNPRNYHDPSHYNYEIGELIFSQLIK